jgi:hypothetical protein
VSQRDFCLASRQNKKNVGVLVDQTPSKPPSPLISACRCLVVATAKALEFSCCIFLNDCQENYNVKNKVPERCHNLHLKLKQPFVKK